MKPPRPQKRSVSPFGSATAVLDDPFAALRAAVVEAFPNIQPTEKPQLKTLEDALHLPAYIEKISDAPANDALELDAVIQFLLRYRESLQNKRLEPMLVGTMRDIFERKTELFMIDHHNKEHCEKMEWQDEYRDVVLFAKERDALVGRYFAPLTESQPGIFSEFITGWVSTDNPDRLLHFLDFCTGSKKPTFEFYLLFSHPAFARIIKNKAQLREMLETAKPLLAKLPSPTWEKDTRKSLGL